MIYGLVEVWASSWLHLDAVTTVSVHTAWDTHLKEVVYKHRAPYVVYYEYYCTCVMFADLAVGAYEASLGHECTMQQRWRYGRSESSQ